MKTITVIPARYSSSHFSEKPLADICGKPIIWWGYQQVKKLATFSQIVAATDAFKDLEKARNIIAGTCRNAVGGAA